LLSDVLYSSAVRDQDGLLTTLPLHSLGGEGLVTLLRDTSQRTQEAMHCPPGADSECLARWEAHKDAAGFYRGYDLESVECMRFEPDATLWSSAGCAVERLGPAESLTPLYRCSCLDGGLVALVTTAQLRGLDSGGLMDLDLSELRFDVIGEQPLLFALVSCLGGLYIVLLMVLMQRDKVKLAQWRFDPLVDCPVEPEQPAAGTPSWLALTLAQCSHMRYLHAYIALVYTYRNSYNFMAAQRLTVLLCGLLFGLYLSCSTYTSLGLMNEALPVAVCVCAAAAVLGMNCVHALLNSVWSHVRAPVALEVAFREELWRARFINHPRAMLLWLRRTEAEMDFLGQGVDNKGVGACSVCVRVFVVCVIWLHKNV
jgi:hypothetical protein